MGKEDVKMIIKILRKRRKQDLADLIKSANGEIDESSTYGSFLFSTISQYLFYLPLEEYHKAKQISEEDKKELLDAILYLYPHQAESPEIISVDFRLLLDKDSDKIINFENSDTVDYDFVEEQLEKSEEKIQGGDYDGAITSAHSLLQGVLSDVYKRCTGNVLPKSGDIRNDYKRVKSLLNLSEEKYSNESIVTILRGLNSVVHGIDAIGNQLGDRHRRTIKPEKHHAKLVVNASRTICDFLYDSLIYQEKNVYELYEKLVSLLSGEKRMLNIQELMIDTDIARHLSKYDKFLKNSVKLYFISHFEISAYRLSDVFFATMRVFFEQINKIDLESIYTKHLGNSQACGLDNFLMEIKQGNPNIIKNKEIIRRIKAIEIIRRQQKKKRKIEEASAKVVPK